MSESEITLRVDNWRPCGDMPDPTAHLLATLVVRAGYPIDGDDSLVHLHLEAVAVDNDQVPVEESGYSAEDMEHLATAVGADGKFDTLTIKGREYIVFASPYC